MKDLTIDFSGTYTIPTSLTTGSTSNGDWTFVGTYTTVSWTEAPTGIYGFSAQNVDEQGISQGEFVKVAKKTLGTTWSKNQSSPRDLVFSVISNRS